MKKPKLKLVGMDGNAFMLLGLAKRAADKAKWPLDKWQTVQREAMSGDYDHLLSVLMENFEVS
jgi:hypothetical protein